MTIETLAAFAEVANVEPQQIVKASQATDKLDSRVYGVYMGQVTLLAAFFLPGDAVAYANTAATANLRWQVVLVDALGQVSVHEAVR